MNGGFSFRRTFSLAHKEVRHILRDPLTLAMALGMPVFMVMFFGLVLSFDVENIHTAYVDRDRTPQSRALLDVFSSSRYFRLTPTADADLLDLLDRERAKAVLVIEPGFGKDVASGRPAEAQVILDGADNQTAGVIAGYLAGVQRAAVPRLTGEPAPIPVRLETRFLFNPELNSRWFVVPGLAVVAVGILSILLTALTVAREWETGSMELLLATPARPLEIIVGKLAPYTVLGLGGFAFVYLAARVAFGIPFRGSHLFFALACVLFLAATLAQGLFISVVTRQQQLAMQFANISGLMPSLLLSGFIFPVENMPVFFRVLTSLLPARWFMVICRGEFLKGADAGELAGPLAALAAIAAGLILLAARKFKRDLEP